MKKAIIAIVCLMGILSSCEIDGTKPCSEERTTAALVSEFPDSLKVGTIFTLDVKYVLENSCGQFDRFDVALTDNSFEVELITKYEGCSCDLEFTEEMVSYDIDIDFPGVYEYKFWQAEGDFDSRSIVIFE